MCKNKIDAKYFIDKLNLKPHIEGGYFNECLSSEDNYNDNQKLWTSIYFLLEQGDVSRLHILEEDELWYYHAGNSLNIYMISPEGKLTVSKLGLNIDNGETPQVLVPKGYIFGSIMEEEGFCLVGNMVAPGFIYDHFKIVDQKDLLSRYPEHKETILKLTKSE